MVGHILAADRFQRREDKLQEEDTGLDVLDMGALAVHNRVDDEVAGGVEENAERMGCYKLTIPAYEINC